MTVFRDRDQSQLAAFKTHVSIAESLLDVVADAGARLRAARSSSLIAELYEQQREAWGNLWPQLDDARRIVAMLGRDLGAFDASRAKVGNVHLATAGMQRIERSMLDATADAIDALRAAVPEVVIPQSPDSEYRSPVRYVRAESFKNPALRRVLLVWLVLVIAMIAAFKLSDC